MFSDIIVIGGLKLNIEIGEVVAVMLNTVLKFKDYYSDLRQFNEIAASVSKKWQIL